jgi:PST family polysaccharide transporter
MGAYNVAYNLADVPAVGVGEQITDVLLASFANMEGAGKKDALLRAFGLLMLIMAPMAVGLGTVAPTIVHTFFNDKWAEVAPMLAVLSVLSVPRPISLALGAYLQAERRPGVVTLLDCLNVVALMGALVVAGHLGGPLTACWAVGAVFSARALANMYMLARTDGIPVATQLLRLLRPLAACFPMVLCVLGVRRALAAAGPLPRGIDLGAEVVTGAFTYAAAALVIARAPALELVRLAKKALGRS